MVLDREHRLVFQRDVKIFRMNLLFMKFFLNSKRAHDFELLFFNSGTIAEKFGYFGGVLDYMKRFPNNRLGYLIIEHSCQFLRQRRDRPRLKDERLFGLRQEQDDRHPYEWDEDRQRERPVVEPVHRTNSPQVVLAMRRARLSRPTAPNSSNA